ncbi:MAG: roadblock/LC7 domain-containing protein, partial [Candidatus Odinarchaeia archaeon]
MSNSELEQKLSRLMDEIPEIEGIIAFSSDGSEITGQTITEMDKDQLIEKALSVIKESSELSSLAGKGDFTGITLSGKEGYIIIENSKNVNIIALADKEAAHSIG